jgi:ubiquinone/menaquinone biosynthesis C-methylase UbiE
MSRYNPLDNLIHKIFKFLKSNDKIKINNIILETPSDNNKLLIQNINKISNIVLKYNLNKNENRQDYIIDKIISAVNRMKPEILNKNIVIADIGGGNGDVLSGINKRTGINGDKNNFICVESKTDWVESYPCDNTNIVYKYWNNDTIDIKDNSCDLVLCMVSLHHMNNDTIYNAINEIKRILKEDGLLFVKEHDSDDNQTLQLIEWEHHLYHILDCAYSGKKTNAEEYLKYSINNFNAKGYWQYLFENMFSFKLKNRMNRFLDEINNEEDAKNITKLYWDIYEK